ncbi:MAG: hypothetical protein WC682_01155 [Parcubacteria group bacterium]|jgi:excinuclease UvrABC nuclease subunit
MPNQKTILVSLALFILISFSYLAILENAQHQIKDSWFIYFENINDDSSNFIIENYSDDTKFSWKIFVDNSLFNQGEVQVLEKNKKNVSIDKPPKGKTIKVIVSHSKEDREIYKNFE